MIEHRFRELFTTSVATASPVGAFLPCPCSMFGSGLPAQVAFVADVYRVAREMTEAQLRQAARPRVPAFSMN